MSVTVNKLSTKMQFEQLPYEDKLQLVKIGRPHPSLPQLKSEHKGKVRKEYIQDVLMRSATKIPLVNWIGCNYTSP